MIERMLGAAFPHRRVVAAVPFPDGFHNTNLRIELDGPPSPLVLRIYRHDPAVCQKELDLLRRLTGRIPVPEIVHAEPAGIDGLPPFTLHRYIEGITLRELKRIGDRRAVAEAAYSAGETLAAIGRVPFEYDGPSISTPQFIDECLASPALQQRLNAEMRDHASALAWSAASELAVVDRETSLVHCDYGKRNLLVHSCAGRWQIAAVLDWEFAVSASPLIDLGHMLRYERATRPLLEPHFSKGFTDAGGVLRQDWCRLSKIFDLSALCEMLRRDPLPPDIEAELVELVEASVTPSAT
jgi:fructokinase